MRDKVLGRSFLLVLISALTITGCTRRPGPLPDHAGGSLPVSTLVFPDGKSISVELAMTPKDREYGLMNRTSLPPDYGMLFVFPREQAMQFWMKNTLVDLDMVFIGADKRITEVHKDVPRSAPDTPEANLARRGGAAQYVLELPAGDAQRHTLSRGQSLVFDVSLPPQ